MSPHSGRNLCVYCHCVITEYTTLTGLLIMKLNILYSFCTFLVIKNWLMLIQLVNRLVNISNK